MIQRYITLLNSSLIKIIFLWFILVLPIAANSHIGNSPAATSYSFIENKGQWMSSVLFKADIPSGALFLERNAFVYHFFDNSVRDKMHRGQLKKVEDAIYKYHAFKLKFEGSNTAPETIGENKLEEYYNYFLGNDPKAWASNVAAFTKINYNELYNGINLDVYAKGKQLKYDFVVQPNADAQQIKLKYEGADKVYLDCGHLVVQTSIATLREKPPVAYQIIGQKKLEVVCEFALKNNQLSFIFPKGYNHAYQLVIDPELMFSTYSGSKADNFGYTATFDSEGFLYSGSSVFDVGYPVTLGAYQTNFMGGDTARFSGGKVITNGTDFAITKYDTTGRKRIYSTLIGGSGSELPHSIITNDDDELLILGTTGSPNFPLVNPIYNQFNKGKAMMFFNVGVFHQYGTDMFICKLNTDGSQLMHSTYLGGKENDGINNIPGNFLNSYNPLAALTYNYADEFRGEIDLDNQGNIYISSCTNSPDFPTTANCFQPAFGGGGLDGCVVKFNSDMSQVIWSSFLGGIGSDALYSIDFDSINNVYVAGGTTSGNLPIQLTSIQRQPNKGRADGYVAKIKNDGSVITASTYWGNISYDQIYFVELDFRGNIYVYGQSEDAGNYFIRNAQYFTANSGQFISKFSADLSSVTWSTSFGSGGGRPNISPTAFLVDLCNKVYLSGWGGETNVSILALDATNTKFIRANSAISTSGMPITADAQQSTTDGSDFYLMVLEDDASKLVYGTYFGGSESDEHVDGGTSRFDRKGKIYQSVCAGCRGFSDFPIKPNPGAVSPTNNSDNCNNAVFKFNFKLPIVVSDFKFSSCNPIEFANKSLIQNATTFLWKFGDGSTSTERAPNHTYSKSGKYKVTLILRDQLTCNLVDSLSKEVYISPLYDGVSATADQYTIYKKLTTTLHSFPNSGYTYQWSPANVLNAPTSPNPIARPLDTTTFQVEITDKINKCTAIARVTVNVLEIICGEPDVFVPNAFTPNNDRDNEVLKVRGTNIESMFFTIYNRWGEKVFETNDQTMGWDGKYKGKTVDPDVFVYYLEGICIDQESFKLKGNITLIK